MNNRTFNSTVLYRERDRKLAEIERVNRYIRKPWVLRQRQAEIPSIMEMTLKQLKSTWK